LDFFFIQTKYFRNSLYLYKRFMPTVLRKKGYRFFFYINGHTPPHIHVEKERSTAKFNLKNAELLKSRRFNAKEIRELRKLVLENSELFKSKWDEYFTGN